MRSIFYGTFWFIVYSVLSAAPLLALLIGEPPPGREFYREFSVGLGFVGLSMLGWQFFLTGRLKWITSPYGIDLVYHFHRNVSLIAFAFILLHPIILVITSEPHLGLFNPIGAPWHRIAAIGSLAAFTIVIFTSLYRIKLGLIYEHWRIIHGLFSIFAVVLAMVHIVGIRYYVQEPIKLGLWIVIGATWVLVLIYIRIVKPIFMKRRPYTVEEVRKERGNSWTLVFKPEGHNSFNFKPGQFAWLILGKTPFRIREHPFSFSSSAMKPERPEMVIKELGDFTATIGEVEPGTRAYMEGPYGRFTIDYFEAPGYVFLAGGVGITPVMSMLKTMRDRADGRPVILFYGTKTWEDTLLREEIDTLKDELNMQVIYVVEEPRDEWKGEKGFITDDIMAKYLPDSRFNYLYFVCGPDLMQKNVKISLDKLGISMEKVQSESYNFV